MLDIDVPHIKEHSSEEREQQTQTKGLRLYAPDSRKGHGLPDWQHPTDPWHHSK